jgi:hypothetical protein
VGCISRDRLPAMNANSTPTPISGTQLTTSAVFDDLRDCKSFNLREVGRGGGGRNQILVYDQTVAADF